MSFPRYPEYKDSGVEWLGQVPAHWAIRPIKAFARFAGGGTPTRENTAYWGGTIPWVSPKDMKCERVEGAEESITEQGLMESTSSLVGPGRVLMVVRSGILKHTIPVAINDVSVALNQDMKAIELAPTDCMPSFLLRWVQGLNNRLLIAWTKQGATVESLDHAYIANSLVPLPSLREQQCIASFLDRETAKIDALVAEQERLIALLKEKRQSVISHAVSKGLNPDAPMKYHGTDSVTAIPEHWQVMALNRLIRQGTTITYGIVQAGPDVEGGVPYIRTSDMSGDSLREGEYLRTSHEIDRSYSRSKVEEGELVVAIRASVGKALIVPRFLHGANLTQGTARVSPGDRVKAEYLALFFRSDFCQGQIQQVSKGTTFQEITLDALRKLPIIVPPMHEQLEIVDRIKEQIDVIDSLQEESERIVEILAERRSALITAAVTGQIDVRGLAHAEAA